MVGHKYTISKFDHSAYFHNLDDGLFIYLLLYIDDILIAYTNKVEIRLSKLQLNQEFEMKDIVDDSKILGIEIHKDGRRGQICLSKTIFEEGTTLFWLE